MVINELTESILAGVVPHLDDKSSEAVAVAGYGNNIRSMWKVLFGISRDGLGQTTDGWSRLH